MLTSEILFLLIAALVAVLAVRYWRQLFTAVLIVFTTVFVFGLLQIATTFAA